VRSQYCWRSSMRRAQLGLVSSTQCIVVIVLAITRPGNTLPQSRSLRRSSRAFEYGTWGGEFRTGFEPQPGDIVAQEHWCSSGFANTDLDLLLKKHGVHKLIVIGVIAHTCVEATVRFAAELGYEVTMVKDATADYSDRDALSRIPRQRDQ
jgi:nicotinamidase-related amidase